MDELTEFVDVWLWKDSKIFKQGAEARLYHCKYFGRNAIIKERFPKKYRELFYTGSSASPSPVDRPDPSSFDLLTPSIGEIAEIYADQSKFKLVLFSFSRHPSLDSVLTKERVRAELSALNKCKMVKIDVPAVYFVDTERNLFIMEEIPGGILARQFIEDCRSGNNFEKIITDFGIRLGSLIAKLHYSGIMHGDLTTSNIILRNGDPKLIVFIDFGLAEGNPTVESKGVDLYVLERAVSSTHANTQFFFDSILRGYESYNKKQYDGVFKKLKEIERRGRKREMLG